MRVVAPNLMEVVGILGTRVEYDVIDLESQNSVSRDAVPSHSYRVSTTSNVHRSRAVSRCRSRVYVGPTPKGNVGHFRHLPRSLFFCGMLPKSIETGFRPHGVFEPHL